MAFDIEGARKSGYKDDEIIGYIAGQVNFDIEGAKKSGYSSGEILDYLSKSSKPASTEEHPLSSGYQSTPKTWGEVGREAISNVPESAYQYGKNIYTAVRHPVDTVTGLSAVLSGVGAKMMPEEGVGTIFEGTPQATDAVINFFANRYGGIENLKQTIAKDPVGFASDVSVVLGVGGASKAAALVEPLGLAKTVISKVIAPSRAKITPEMEEILRISKETGVPLTPADVLGRNSMAISMLESALAKIPASAGQIAKARTKQMEALLNSRQKLFDKHGSTESIEAVGQQIRTAVDNYLAKLGLAKSAEVDTLRNAVLKKLGSSETYESLGGKVQEVLAARSRVWNEKAKQLYSEVGKLIPEETVINTPNLQKTAQEIQATLSNLPKSMQKSNLRQIVDEITGLSGGQTQRDIYGIPKKVGYNWRSVTGIRSELGSRIAEADAAFRTAQPGVKGLSNKEAGIYKTLKKALEKDIEGFANATGGEVKEAFDLANAFYREGKQLYNKPAIFKALKNNPEKVIDTIVRPGNVTEIKLMKQAVGEKGFEPIKAGVTKKLLEGDDILSQLEKYGDETLSQVYKPDELKFLKNMASQEDIVKVDMKNMTPNFLKTITNMSPENVVNYIVRPENTRNIYWIKEAVGESGIKDIKAKFLEQILETNLYGKMQPVKFAKQLEKYGDNTLKQLFNEGELKAIKDLGTMSKYAYGAERIAGNPSGTAQNLITVTTGGVFLNSIASGLKLAIPPYALAKLYLSPVGRKYLTEGYRLSASSRKGVENAAKILAISRLNATQRQIGGQ